jgi:GcrA cell cycle regulator
MELTSLRHGTTPIEPDAAPQPSAEAPFCWTEPAVARLRQLWANGRSAAQIAREIGGLSRAAVIGKVRRLGLDALRAASAHEPRSISAVPRCASVVGEITRVEKAQAQRARALARQQALRALVQGEALAQCPEPVAQTAPPTSRPCSLLQLGPDTCRWPIGDPDNENFHFCGAPPDADHVYCAHHRRIAHEPRDEISTAPA